MPDFDDEEDDYFDDGYTAADLTVITLSGGAESPPAREPIYHYTDESGLVMLGRGRSKSTIIANFKPVLIRELEVRDEDSEPQHAFDVRFEKQGESVELHIASTDLESDRNFRKRVAPALPASFTVYDRGWNHILPALSELADGTKYSRDVVYSSMGWTDGQSPVFLLPGMPHSIGADGISTQARMGAEAISKLPKKMQLYGSHVRPMTDDEYETADGILSRLVLLNKASVAFITMQLAGPLCPIGVMSTPPLLHVQAPTTSFKSPLGALSMCLFGNFSAPGAIPENWSSTQNALQARLWEGRHVTNFIDDYKVSMLKFNPVQLIQNYADGSSRSRMASDQTNRTSVSPRGLLMSAGEDSWGGQESMEGRTIFYNMTRPPEDEKYLWLTRFAEVRQQSRLLATVGGTYLQWIAQQGLEPLSQSYLELRARFEGKLARENPTMNTKMYGTLATLFSVSAIVRRFLGQHLPKSGDLYETEVKRLYDELVISSVERSETSRDLSPFPATINAIQQAIHRRQVHFNHRSTRNSMVLGDMMGQSIGYYDEDNIYLTEEATYSWLLREAKRDGRQITYSWKAFCQETRQALGPYTVGEKQKDERTSFVISARNKLVRASVLPRAMLDWQYDNGDPETLQEDVTIANA